jgi:DHA1 family tetracycline resistance protein-like MFS transporter
MQGILTSLMSLTSIFGPPLMNNLLLIFTRANAPVHFPGAAFFVGAIFMLGSSAAAYYSLHKNKLRAI